MSGTGQKPNRRRACRGQAGITIVELLFVVVVGGMVLVPIMGMMTFVLRRHEPTVTMNDSASQLRLFRSHIAGDWSGAAVVKSNPTWPYLECSGPGIAGGTIRVAILNAGKSANDPQRILYKTKVMTDGTTSLIRRECQHVLVPAPPAAPPDPYLPSWGYGGRTDVANRGSDRVIVERVKELIIPTTCNPGNAVPVPCDMNLTVTTTDGQSATVRLHQEIGRTS